MKTYVQFDTDGRIYSIVTVEGPDDVRAMVDVEPGLSVAEIDAAELEPYITDSDVDGIRAVTQDYRVSVPVAVKATLTKAKSSNRAAVRPQHDERQTLAGVANRRLISGQIPAPRSHLLLKPAWVHESADAARAWHPSLGDESAAHASLVEERAD